MQSNNIREGPARRFVAGLSYAREKISKYY